MDQSKQHKVHLVKYSSPTKWDHAPYTTIWRITNEDGDDDIRIQMSTDPENPNWVPMADVMVKAFDRFYHDKLFIDQCIDLYKQQQGQGAISECNAIKFCRQ